MDTWGLAGHLHYAGELDRSAKLAFLHQLSVLSVPGSYADPKGLFLLEALASGIPIVQPRRGAATEIVETTGGGVLVEPDNPDALTQGILELWSNRGRREECGASGYEGVRAHYSAVRMAERAMEVYRELTDGAGVR
jgi:glycosyltransferase involved in cell wall biosynthesis